MKKFLCFAVLSLALCLTWLPGAVTSVNAYDLKIYVLEFDNPIAPGDIWDCSIRIYNTC